MSMVCRWALLGLITTLGAMPVAAQLKPERPTGSRVPADPKDLAAGRAAQLQFEFARCIYRRNPKAAAAILANSDPVRVDLTRAGIKSLDSSFGLSICLGEQADAGLSNMSVRMPAPTMRLMMAEQAYLTTVPVAPTLQEGAAENVARSYVSEGQLLGKARALAEFADCVVFRNVVGADALVRTRPGSGAENAAARSLGPVLGACLSAGNNTVLNIMTIRSLVADGLWARFVRASTR
jgi:hypothetical protein